MTASLLSPVMEHTVTDPGPGDPIVLEQLTHHYPGFQLGPISLTLAAGARCALVGRNGAGKTTLLNILAGQRPVQAGSARVAGLSARDDRIRIRERVALCGDAVRGCGWMTAREHLEFLSHFYDGWHMDAALELARALELPLDKTLGGMSRGTAIKVTLAAAWGQGADVLLFDEPTAGLDPVARVTLLRQLQAEIARTPSVTVIIATHILEDLDYMAITDLLALRDGTCEHVRPTVPIAPGRGSAAARQLLHIDPEMSEL
jgi:ABC-2 type transport system ATP-binding protein